MNVSFFYFRPFSADMSQQNKGIYCYMLSLRYTPTMNSAFFLNKFHPIFQVRNVIKWAKDNEL